MTVLQILRCHRSRLARLTAGLFVLAWLAIVAAPCAMAMHAADEQHEHACPKCPPAPPCHQAAAADCEHPDSFDATRGSDAVKAPVVLATNVAMAALPVARVTAPRPLALHGPPRAGPRLHLLHAHFNE